MSKPEPTAESADYEIERALRLVVDKELGSLVAYITPDRIASKLDERLAEIRSLTPAKVLNSDVAHDTIQAILATAKAEGRREQRNETLKFAKKYRNNPGDLYEDLIHELTIAALKGDTKPPKLDPSKGDSIRHGA